MSGTLGMAVACAALALCLLVLFVLGAAAAGLTGNPDQ